VRPEVFFTDGKTFARAIQNGNVVQDVDPVTAQTREFVFNGDK